MHACSGEGSALKCIHLNLNLNGRQGPNRWRDQLLPEVILNEWIKNKNFPEADWSRSTDGSSDKADGKDHESDKLYT